MKVGFVGLGIMGRPMAKNLIKAGHDLVVMDLNTEAVEDLRAAGAESAATGREVAAAVDVVVTMLPDGPDVEAAVLGTDGIAEGLREGATLIDMSSIAPGISRTVGKALEAKGVTMLDAPVSGGEPGAIAGKLSIMVGGDQEVFDKYRDLLLAMGSSATLVGDLGAGNIAKLANQAIVAVNIAVLSEALVLAQKSGVSPGSVIDAIRGGLAGSAVLEQKAQKMLDQDFAPGFRINLHIKDLNNALQTAHEAEAPLPLTSAVREMMSSLAATGHAGEDHSSLLRVYQQLGQAVLGD